MEFGPHPYSVLKVASSERRRIRDTVLLQPSEPIMYFDPYIPTKSPELDFNAIKYYKHHNAATEGNPIGAKVIRQELMMNDVERFANTTVQRTMSLPGGEIKPAFLPLMSDIKGYVQHQGVATFVEWFFKHHEFEEDEVVPNDLVPIFGLVPTFDAESTLTFAFPLVERHIFVGAKTNALHVMKIEERMTAMNINVLIGVTQKKGIHYHRISISGKLPELPSDFVFNEGDFILIWNAKDVLRPSFVDNFRMLFESYLPVLVIITEARPKYLQMWELTKLLPGPYQIQSSGHGAVGGVVLLWNKLVEPYFRHRSSALTGHALDLEIQPGPLIKPPSPLGDEDYSDDDGYDYIGLGSKILVLLGIPLSTMRDGAEGVTRMMMEGEGWSSRSEHVL